MDLFKIMVSRSGCQAPGEEAGQTKTMVVERALQGDFADYDMKQQILRQAAAGQLAPREEVSRDDD